MQVATTGPCLGHPCDQCNLCKQGRCCRRDNPNYALPAEGDWSGPIYGEIGVQDTDGDKLECHACGGWYASVAQHAVGAHNLYANEYKAIFGLKRSASLDGPHLNATRSRNAKRLVAAGILPRIVDHPEWRPTPEQLSQATKGTKRRTQTLNTVRDPQYRTRLNQKISEINTKRKTFTCRACSKVVKCNPANRKHTTCSPECALRVIGMVATKRHAANRAKHR